jgi:hypothetical protein
MTAAETEVVRCLPRVESKKDVVVAGSHSQPPIVADRKGVVVVSSQLQLPIDGNERLLRRQ